MLVCNTASTPCKEELGEGSASGPSFSWLLSWSSSSTCSAADGSAAATDEEEEEDGLSKERDFFAGEVVEEVRFAFAMLAA